MMISRMGYSPSGMSGLGSATVYGRSRVPLPPASTTARLDIVEVLFVTAQIAFVAKPLDGQHQPVIQRCQRREARGLFHLLGVAEQAFYLAAGGTNASWVGNHPCLAVHQAGDPGNQFADRDLVSRADMKNFAGAALHPGDGYHAGARVFDKSEVPSSGEVAQSHFFAAGSQLRDDCGNHGARRLPGTVCVEGARHYHW